MQSVDEAGPVIPRETLTGLRELVPPRSYVEELLVRIWQRIIRVAPIGIEDHWFDLGGDSLGAALLFGEIEASFGTKLALGALLEADTVAKLASLLDARPALRNQTALIFGAERKLPPLFCVHGLHGTADFAGFLSQYLDQPIIGFQARSLAASVAEPSESIAEMAADYIDTLRQHQRRGPYRLIGWCVGSLIAFEMARKLSAEGQEIAKLILIDPPVRPFEERTASPVDEAIGRLWSMQVDSGLAKAYRDAVIRTVSAMGRAALNYEPSPYTGELVILCSEENFGSVAADGSEWRTAAKGRFAATKIAPTHLSVVGDYLPQLGAHIRRLLDPSLGRSD